MYFTFVSLIFVSVYLYLYSCCLSAQKTEQLFMPNVHGIIIILSTILRYIKKSLKLPLQLVENLHIL